MPATRGIVIRLEARMTRTLGSVVAVGVACAAVLGCSQEVCGCTLLPDIAIDLSGVVFSRDSTPVSGATVEITGGAGSCEASDDFSAHDGRSDASGEYHAHLEGHDIDGAPIRVVARARREGHGPSAPFTVTYDHLPDDPFVEVRHDFYLTE
jgi:hypothetical protein